MEQLILQMKRVLSDTFLMYMKAHSYHWNVEGHNFAEFHSFFGTLYTELHGSIDTIAECIRTLDAYAPSSLSRMIELSSVADENTIPTCEMMVVNLQAANRSVINCLKEAHVVAETEKNYAIVSFVDARLEAHEKYAWMLRSISKK